MPLIIVLDAFSVLITRCSSGHQIAPWPAVGSAGLTSYLHLRSLLFSPLALPTWRRRFGHRSLGRSQHSSQLPLPTWRRRFIVEKKNIMLFGYPGKQCDRSGIQDWHFGSYCWELTIFGLKRHKLFVNSVFRIRDPGWKNPNPGFRMEKSRSGS